MKNIIKGVVVLIIGGTVYSVSQGDIVKNFAEDTGLSHEEAAQYVESITEDDLVPYDQLGSEFILEGQKVLSLASEIDCENYIYEWESESISCNQGKAQMKKFGNDAIALGKAYKKLDTESATAEDISSVIRLIDVFNGDFSLPMIVSILDFQDIDEMKKTNSYNKSLLKAALDSN